MTYLLDTDILSNLLRRAPSPALIRKVATIAPDEQHTSSITIGELIYGAHRHPDRSAELLQRIDSLVRANLAVVAFDELAARRYGELRASLERAGTPIGDADVRIAAIALVHGMTVVSGNVRHFKRVPELPIENWLTD